VTIMSVDKDDSPPYVHPLSSGVYHTTEPADLDDDIDEDVQRRLKEIADARAEAAVSGRNYVIR